MNHRPSFLSISHALLTLILAGIGALGLRPFFKAHAAYALNAGVSPEELQEIVDLISVPAGFPRAIEAAQALHELLVERGIVLKATDR